MVRFLPQSAKAVLLVLATIGCLLADGCEGSSGEDPSTWERWFSCRDFLMVFQARFSQVRRVVLIGRTINMAKVNGPFLEEGYHPNRNGERVVNGENYYIVGDKAYRAPPGDLVIIHGWAEACVVVDRVPPGQLMQFYNAIKDDVYTNLESALRHLGEGADNRKARLLVDKLITGEVVGTQWRDENRIPAAKTIPYEELPK